jgi:hypothetical protein
MKACGIDSYSLDTLRKLIVPQQIGKWAECADTSWFVQREERCETVLSDFFGNGA